MSDWEVMPEPGEYGPGPGWLLLRDLADEANSIPRYERPRYWSACRHDLQHEPAPLDPYYFVVAYSARQSGPPSRHQAIASWPIRAVERFVERTTVNQGSLGRLETLSPRLERAQEPTGDPDDRPPKEVAWRRT